MSIRYTAKVRRGAAAIALTVGLLVAVAGCGDGGGGGEPDNGSSGSMERTAEDGASAQDSKPAEEEAETLVEVSGDGKVVLAISSVSRDSGGFVTVSGQVKNTGSEGYFKTSAWRGNEKELVSNGYSLGGAALVDQEGKKRYYVLRDTEGRCLCTTGISKVDPGQSIPVFIQFPAPPEGTTEVEFTLPTFDSATVEISGE